MKNAETLKSGIRGVVIVSPGGITHGGGIGSVTRTMKGWIDVNCPDVRVDVLDPRGEKKFNLSIIYLPLMILRLIFIRIFHKSEILHLQVSENFSFPRKGVLLFLGRFLGMGVVLHHHGAEFVPFFRRSSPRMQAFVRAMINAAEVNIVLGEASRRFLINEVSVPASQVVVRFNAAADVGKSAYANPQGSWQFLLVANLSPRKGVKELLHAVAQLAHSGAPVSLTLAGGGDIDNYQEMAKALGIEERCTFTGWIGGNDIHTLLLSRTALVLPSFHEGFPMSIIEALSARIPIVTTAVGSIPELLENEKTCLFVQPGHVEELADALRRIATDDVLRQTLVENGRRLYERYFEVNAYMDRMMRLYQGVNERSLGVAAEEYE